MSARTHRRALKAWTTTIPMRLPRWYWPVMGPLIAVAAVTLVWSFITLEDPPGWIQPTWIALNVILWPLLLVACVQSYLMEYRAVRAQEQGT